MPVVGSPANARDLVRRRRGRHRLVLRQCRWHPGRRRSVDRTVPLQRQQDFGGDWSADDHRLGTSRAAAAVPGNPAGPGRGRENTLYLVRCRRKGIHPAPLQRRVRRRWRSGAHLSHRQQRMHAVRLSSGDRRVRRDDRHHTRSRSCIARDDDLSRPSRAPGLTWRTGRELGRSRGAVVSRPGGHHLGLFPGCVLALPRLSPSAGQRWRGQSPCSPRSTPRGCSRRCG